MFSPQQTEIIQEVSRECQSAHLCTETGDFDLAMAAITRMYERIGFCSPRFHIVESPLAAERYLDSYCHALSRARRRRSNRSAPPMGPVTRLEEEVREDRNRGHPSDQYWIEIWTRLRNQLKGKRILYGSDVEAFQTEGRKRALEPHFENRLGKHVLRQLSDQVEIWLGTGVHRRIDDVMPRSGPVMQRLSMTFSETLDSGIAGSDTFQAHPSGNLGNLIELHLADVIEDDRISYMGTPFRGSQDSRTWGPLEACRRLGVIYSADLAASLEDHLSVCNSIGWWYPFEDFCILSDRPSAIALDSQGRLHCSGGPALQYRDGYALYSRHGVLIPEWIFTRPQELSPQLIDEETNTFVTCCRHD